MDYSVKIKREINPIEEVNCVSQFLFLYTCQLFKKGYKSDLEEKDLYEVPSTFTSKELGDQFENVWKKQRKEKQSIIWILLKCHGFPYFLLGLSQLILKTTFMVINPFVVGKIVLFFTPGQTNITQVHASLYAFVFIILLIMDSLYDQWYKFKLISLELRVRVAFCSLVYRKSLKLSSSYLDQMHIGKIVTLITKDVYNFEIFIGKANLAWISVVQLIVLTYMIYSRVGYLVVFLLVASIVLLIIQVYICLKTTSMKLKMFKETDARLQITKDALQNIRTVKMHSWESFFVNKLNKLRKNEIQLTYKIFLLKLITCTNQVIWTGATFFPWLILAKTLGKQLIPEVVYFVFGNYKMISFLMSEKIPNSLCQTAQAFATIKRINQFLKTEELQKQQQTNKSAKIEFENVSVNNKKETVLCNVNFKLDKHLTIVTGKVGSGKTCLLKTILGEYIAMEGKLNVEGNISYASQEPWLFPSTIRQNILFGENYNEERYLKVLEKCDLIHDFNRLENGDATIVENYGYNLSKGQRTRINLARAVYKEKNIYLLDDSLEALDVFVSNYIFEECIQKFLRDKVVLFVTKNVKYTERARNVININNGLVNCTTNKLKENSHKISCVTHFTLSEKYGDSDHEETPLLHPINQRNMYAEVKKKGRVKYEVYRKWIQAGGGVTYFIFVMCIFAFPRLLFRYIETLIMSWVTYEAVITNYTKINYTDNKEFETVLHKQEKVTITYFSLYAAQLITTMASLVFFMKFIKNSSMTLHTMLVGAVSKAKLSFFEINFVGNILNRFSKDLINIDEVIPMLFLECYNALIYIVTMMIVLIYVQNLFILPSLVLSIIIIYLGVIYLCTARSLKRLEATTKSPIVGYYNATLSGITTIRANNLERKLVDEYDGHQNLYTSASFMSLCINVAFNLGVRLVCVIFAGFVIIYFFVVKPDAGSVGYAIFLTLFLVNLVGHLVGNWFELETYMTSVERVLEYTKIKQETLQSLEDEWSNAGEIVYEDVNVAHSNLIELILKSLSFVVKPKEKIGIVGRTGAGKSSLIATLFGLNEFEGKIFVNGVDIKTLPLKYLRSSISIIPQDPVIFKGTIRENIDPLQEYTDAEIWNALEIVQLKTCIENLDEEICEDSSTFSLGKKQLLCLARILIKNNKIVVIDEATANVDRDTEMLISDIIRNKFAECTVLMVSHDLETLSHCDKIMVLDNGEIVEYDEPKFLMQNLNGVFYKMMHMV